MNVLTFWVIAAQMPPAIFCAWTVLRGNIGRWGSPLRVGKRDARWVLDWASVMFMVAVAVFDLSRTWILVGSRRVQTFHVEMFATNLFLLVSCLCLAVAIRREQRWRDHIRVLLAEHV